jgi:hypothetical protein
MTDGVRKSTRLTTKRSNTRAKKAGTSADADVVPSLSTKRKALEPVDPQTQLRNILENPKSILTTTDISVRYTPQHLAQAKSPAYIAKI